MAGKCAAGRMRTCRTDREPLPMVGTSLRNWTFPGSCGCVVPFSSASMKRRTILVLAALPVVALVVSEVVCRMVEKPGDLPSIRLTMVNDLPGFAREARWESDGYGLRKIGWEDGQPRVLCIGSESTMPLLQSDAASWWGQMRKRLAAEGVEAAVAAAGVNYGTITHCLQWLNLTLDPVKPKVVVLALGPSEVLGRASGYRYDPAAVKHAPVSRPGGWKGKVLDGSAIARCLRHSRMEARLRDDQDTVSKENVLRDRWAKEHELYLKAPEASELPWVHDPADEISEGLRVFVGQAKAKGFKPVVLWLPWPHRPGMSAEAQEHFRFLTPALLQQGAVNVRVAPGWVDGRMRAFRMRAQAVCEGLGVPFIDAASRLGDAAGVYFGDVQLTDAGADQVGAAAAPVVKAALAAP